MCYTLKYGIWKWNEPGAESVNGLVSGGYPPLVAMVLASRGISTPAEAREYLSCDRQLTDPFRLRDMGKAAARVAKALEAKEKICVFGDYDVDGITATCLLTDYLRSAGGDCIPYIPGRLEEGYGLNPIAIDQLHKQGVKLIITVDCGITAVEEAALCASLGIELVITDHHECKDVLPTAVAVVDAHRPDCTYPHKDLSGVGVAFKLAAALHGDQTEILRRYADMVCLGTVADVMPLTGENRVFVAHGLESLKNTTRPGILALMRLSGCDKSDMTANAVGYTLAPRINAAGRMGRIELATELFLTEDPKRGEALANALCELNKQRQNVESDIYRQAVEMLPEEQLPDAIVLADETWHQGVVGIVASRIAEEYCCPTFLICLDGEHGKASSRSYGGFNLFSSLTTLSSLLESYGGHELAAGFTIGRSNIPAFREQVGALARAYYKDDGPRTVLEADCTVKPELLTVNNIDSLARMEPCGNGCAKPVLVVTDVTVDRVSMVGNGRHVRMRLKSGRYALQAIWFSTTEKTASLAEGDVVDVAFIPQINEFRGERSVQLNVQDIRPACKAECSVDTTLYRKLCCGEIDREGAQKLLPDRNTLGMVWRYLAMAPDGYLEETPTTLCRKIVRWTGLPLDLGKLLTCLDIFADVGLLEKQRLRRSLGIRLLPAAGKADLMESPTLQRLLKESE
ncbi:MAG: single-stranded-DNA-specific exonuclease RecJ [Oscillospiraceae bacterium]|nr:single-stranded-DNA-specific exonuclease RecJ [Oscillospiraceae bacterium]